MSYYRYMTGVYRSYWPELRRSLRSCSAPRHIPEAVPSRISRASSLPFYSAPYGDTPHYERAVSVPRQLSYSYDTRCIVTPPPATQYSNFDYKVLDYMGRLDREDSIRTNINTTRMGRSRTTTTSSHYVSSSYSSTGTHHQADYSQDILGRWKHYNLSGATLAMRDSRARSPLLSRELCRYFEKKPNYIGDASSGAAEHFRHYNYGRVPYFGGSDDYRFIKRKEYRGGRYL